MPAKCSLAASSRVAVVSGVGCDLPSSTLSSLSLSPRDFHHRPSPVSAAQRGPRIRPLMCSLSPPLLMLPSPSSACCRSQLGEHNLSTSLHITVVCGVVGCNPPSLTSSLLSPSRSNLPAPPTLRHRRSRHLHVLATASTSHALAANDDAMPSILSSSSTSNESAPPRTKEIVPLPPLPRPPSSPFSLISIPPGMLPLKPCGINDPTRVHP